MEDIATYYVTLKPTSVNGVEGKGMTNIAYVPDPAIEEVGIFLEKHDPRIVADEKTQKSILEYLATVGIEKPSHWKEVSEEDYLSAREVNLTTDPTARESFNDFPNKEGTGQWLVRYEYSGPQDFKNRTFCADMMGLGRIYTEEEIKNGLSNSEFGNYSIFDYKGSYGCRHTWKRMIFFEDYEDDEVRRVGNVPQVTSKLDDREATTLNAFLSKDEKMQVCAPLLIPNKDIFRNDELGRYNMRFTPDTISDLRTLAKSKGMFERKDLFKDTHEGTTAPSYVIEEWIIESEDDKAYTEYGFNPMRVPVGSWMVLSQITDKNYWNKEIKENKKHAYSIEALMNLTIIKLSESKQEYGDVIVMNQNGDYLLLQRAEDDDYEPNKVCFAGGKIEKGEDIKSGALRELKEETGIEEKDANHIETITNSDGTKSHYFFTTTTQDFTPSDEHKAMSWVKNLDSIPSDMFIENDKKRLVDLLNKVKQIQIKMEEQTIVLPDGEHLINGTIYIVESGKVVATKEVTPEQEAVVEEVAEAAAETSDAEELEEEKKPEEMAAEVEEPKVEEKLMEEPKVEKTDKLAKLEKQQEELMSEIASIKSLMETPQEEEVKIEMSETRPFWKRASDAINGINRY